MGLVPVLNCVFSSGWHICGILFVNVPFLGVQHVRPAVILLLQYQSSPIQQSKQNSYLGLMICCLVFIKFIWCVQVRVIVCWKWVGGPASLVVSWHILCYPLLTIVDSFIDILAWADCPCCYTIFIGLTLAPR